jgi:hypothetical protein
MKKSLRFKESCVADGKELIEEMMFAFRLETNGMMVRRRCLEEVGKLPVGLRFAGEGVWLVRLAKEHRFAYLAEPLSIVRHHPGQIFWTCSPKDAEMGYLATLTEIFSDPVLREHFRSLRGRAYSNHYLWIAGRAYGKDMSMARRYLKKSFVAYPRSLLGRKGVKSINVYLKSFVPDCGRKAIRGLKHRIFSSRAVRGDMQVCEPV